MSAITTVQPTRPVLRSAARFAVIGVLNTAVDMILFTLLHLLIGLPRLSANILSYSAGIINAFFFHRSWTFAGSNGTPAGRQFIQFVTVSLSAMAINTLVVLALSPVLERLINDAVLATTLAKICATGAGMLWNFLVNRAWTFRSVA